jgi:hypothetical protein
MERKGQAAVEFLMTYGWAILAAIIAIGVLAYFGVFSPGKFTPTASVLSPPLYANNWQIKTTGVSIEVKNNGGDDVTLGNVTIAGCATINSGASLPASGLVTVTVPCTLTSGVAFKGDVTVNYLKTGSSLASQSTGTVAGKVTA